VWYSRCGLFVVDCFDYVELGCFLGRPECGEQFDDFCEDECCDDLFLW